MGTVIQITSPVILSVAFSFSVETKIFRPANSPSFPGSLKVFHQISRLEQQISQELPTVALFIFYFLLISLFSSFQEGK